MNKTAYIKSKVNKNSFADSGDLYAKFVQVLCATLKWEGHTSTLAALNLLTQPMPNLVIELTDAGVLTKGTDLAVVAGEKVYFNGTSWVKISIGDKRIIEVITANKALRAADSGKMFFVATDALVIDLPATEKGVEFTFVNTGADGNNIITVSPLAADGIFGTVTLAASVVVLDGTIDKDLINTKATSKSGDSATITGTGVTGTRAWLLRPTSGIWARQA